MTRRGLYRTRGRAGRDFFSGRVAAHLGSLIALLCVGLPAFAQDVEEEAPRRYHVEVIVFSYAEEVSPGSEIFVPDVPEESPIDIDGAEDDVLAEFGDIDETNPEPPAEPVEAATPETVDQTTEPDFVVTPVDELRMLDVIDKLETLDVYEPIYHAAWTQAALPREDGIEISLDMLAEPPEDLSGSFTLYLSRFLHLVVSLTLDDGAEAPVAVDLPARFGFLRREVEKPAVRYRIDEDRIFKSGDTRYFDHPKFGAIVRIERIEEEEESAAGDSLDGGVAVDQPVQ